MRACAGRAGKLRRRREKRRGGPTGRIRTCRSRRARHPPGRRSRPPARRRAASRHCAIDRGGPERGPEDAADSRRDRPPRATDPPRRPRRRARRTRPAARARVLHARRLCDAGRATALLRADGERRPPCPRAAGAGAGGGAGGRGAVRRRRVLRRHGALRLRRPRHVGARRIGHAPARRRPVASRCRRRQVADPGLHRAGTQARARADDPAHDGADAGGVAAVREPGLRPLRGPRLRAAGTAGVRLQTGADRGAPRTAPTAHLAPAPRATRRTPGRAVIAQACCAERRRATPTHRHDFACRGFAWRVVTAAAVWRAPPAPVRAAPARSGPNPGRHR